MQSTPMGPTGAAMPKPMASPRRKTAKSTREGATASGGAGWRSAFGRRLECGVDCRAEPRLVCRRVEPRHDLAALVDDHRVGRALEAEAVGNEEARVEGGGIAGSVPLQKRASVGLGVVHLEGEHLDVPPPVP